MTYDESFYGGLSTSIDFKVAVLFTAAYSGRTRKAVRNRIEGGSMTNAIPVDQRSRQNLFASSHDMRKMVALGTPFQCLTYSLLLLPILLLTIYFLAAFPNPPETVYLYPGLSSLPLSCKSWKLYPEDFYQGGAYASFPYGKVHSGSIAAREGR